MNSFSEQLRRVDEVVVKTIKGISYVSGVCLLGIMAVATLNVLGEKLRMAGLPVSGVPASTEIIQYLHIPVVFLASAYVTLDRGHTNIDLISSKFPKGVQQAFTVMGSLLGGVICAFLSQRGFVQMMKFYVRNKCSSTGGAGFPLWPFALILAFGFAMLSFTFFWSIVRQLAMKDLTKGENH